MNAEDEFYRELMEEAAAPSQPPVLDAIYK